MTKLGAETFVNHGCYFMDGGGITIGKNCFIGPFTGFYTATHPTDFTRHNAGLEWAKPIRVGDNCRCPCRGEKEDRPNALNATTVQFLKYTASNYW